jgi:hypothetical protein
MGAEIFIIAMSSAVICSILVFAVQFFANDLVREVFIR